jgi:enoyl-CoA hydratase/carnithine racemase
MSAVTLAIMGPVATMTLAAPERGNSLTLATLGELLTALRQAEAEPIVRLIVLRAIGADFCRGMDFDLLQEESLSELSATLDAYIATMSALARSSRPLISLVEGNVSGGGLGFLGASDIVIATPNVTFMLPEVVIGMIPALVSPLLLRRIAPARLRFMAISSRAFSSAEALTLGLIDEIATPAADHAGERSVVDSVHQVGIETLLKRHVKRLLRSSPAAIELSKAYFERLGPPVDLAVEFALAREVLTEWLSRPETLTELRRFASGLTPSWFQSIPKGAVS